MVSLPTQEFNLIIVQKLTLAFKHQILNPNWYVQVYGKSKMVKFIQDSLHKSRSYNKYTNIFCYSQCMQRNLDVENQL